MSKFKNQPKIDLDSTTFVYKDDERSSYEMDNLNFKVKNKTISPKKSKHKADEVVSGFDFSVKDPSTSAESRVFLQDK